MRFLVTGANGDLAEAVSKVLRSYYPNAVIDGADAAGVWPGKLYFDHVFNLPSAIDEDYSDKLKELAQTYDIVIPSTELEIARVIKDHLIAELPLLVSVPDLSGVFLDKFKTIEWLRMRGFQTPKTKLLGLAKDEDLPLLLKPRRASGGRGQETIRSPERLKLARDEATEELVAQELLEVVDQEFTCALFSDGRETRSLVMQRWLSGDRTSKFVIRDKPEIFQMLEKLAHDVALVGCINVQFRLMTDGAKIFEINPRLSSTVMMRHLVGFSDLIWWIETSLGRSVPEYIPPCDGATVYRLSAEKVVYNDERIPSA